MKATLNDLVPRGRYPELRLTGMQIKSAAKARALAKALDIIEVECGIKVVRVTLDRCFICPDINWAVIQRTPMQRVLSRIARKLQSTEPRDV